MDFGVCVCVHAFRCADKCSPPQKKIRHEELQRYPGRNTCTQKVDAYENKVPRVPCDRCLQ